MATEFRRIIEDMTVDPNVPQLHAEVTVSTRVAVIALLELLDRQARENVQFRRVAGDALCGGCGLAYSDHPDDEDFPFLTRACGGQLVKL